MVSGKTSNVGGWEPETGKGKHTSRSAMAADRAAVWLLLYYQSQWGVQDTLVLENGPSQGWVGLDK